MLLQVNLFLYSFLFSSVGSLNCLARCPSHTKIPPWIRAKRRPRTLTATLLVGRKKKPLEKYLKTISMAAAACATLFLSARATNAATSSSRSSSEPPQLASTTRRPTLRNPSNAQLHAPRRRRDLLLGGAITVPLIGLGASRSEAKEVEVGSYLPASPSNPDFVVFKATPKDTPALRAGNVQPYQFELPPTWKQLRVANILSGNYCQPKCAEPWVEVKFEDEKQGKVQVVASPIIRLTNKPSATIEDIGSPEKLMASLGPFVTGNTYDPDELIETSIGKLGDQTYYTYVLETPFALTGTHNLAKATAKGSTVVLFVASANDRQWPTSQKTLKSILDSFQI